MRVNGDDVKLGSECTLKSFIDSEGYDIKRVAVERNGEIVPKTHYETVVLNDGDCLEIVAFIGGG